MLDLDLDRIYGLAIGRFIGVRADFNLRHPLVITRLHAETMDPGELSPAEAAGKDRSDPMRLLTGVRRPERLLVVTDAAQEVARMAAPIHHVVDADRDQSHLVDRARRDRTIELDVQERLQARDEVDPPEEVISPEQDLGA